jgi:hypothetical protein
MKKMIPIATILAVVAVIGVFPVAFASHSTPFNGRFSGSFTFTSQTTVTITATGQLEHLGRTMLAASSTNTGPTSASCKGGFTASEQDTFTAANGDKVSSSTHDVICPASQTTFHLTGSWTITGGTGRFDHASGTGSVDGTAAITSMTGGTFSFTVTGTITY